MTAASTSDFEHVGHLKDPGKTNWQAQCHPLCECPTLCPRLTSAASTESADLYQYGRPCFRQQGASVVFWASMSLGIFIHRPIHIHIHIHAHTCMYVYIHTYPSYTCMYTRMHLHVSACLQQIHKQAHKCRHKHMNQYWTRYTYIFFVHLSICM